jgi:SAM-dependent methyltransferase
MTRGGSRAYYEEWYASRTWRDYVPLLTDVIRRSSPGPMLDVGAGPALLVEAATRWGLSCIGVETSAAALAIARSRGFRLPLVCQDVSEPLPFRGGSFQTVVLNQVFEHLEPPVGDRLLEECRRQLRPGGVLYLTTPSRFNRQERRDDPTHINLLSPSELRDLLHRAGFVDVRPFDVPLPLLGRGRVGMLLMTTALRLTGWQRISASANATAVAPSG